MVHRIAAVILALVLATGAPAQQAESETDARIRIKVVNTILEHVDVSGAPLGSNLRTDLGADELGMIDIILDLEESFKFETPESDFERILTVSDLIDYVKEHRTVGP